MAGFDRGGALFERIDLVDQLRFRLAKALFPERGWIGHMPLLANRHYLGGLFAEEDANTPWRNEPIRAGLALALADAQHHPQCPLWVNFGLSRPTAATSAFRGRDVISAKADTPMIFAVLGLANRGSLIPIRVDRACLNC